MGVATAADIADKLIADGVSPAIPVAVLENGTRADMRTLRTLLADLGDMVAREQVKSPALIVVGEVVAHALAQGSMQGYRDMLASVRPAPVEGRPFVWSDERAEDGQGSDSPNGKRVE